MLNCEDINLKKHKHPPIIIEDTNINLAKLRQNTKFMVYPG